MFFRDFRKRLKKSFAKNSLYQYIFGSYVLIILIMVIPTIYSMAIWQYNRSSYDKIIKNVGKANTILKVGSEDIPEELVDRAILKEIKSVKEQIDTCPADRTDLKDEYAFTLSVMEEYAPKQLSEEEIRSIINEKFADVIATKNKGQIMKAVMGELKGKADGKIINQVVSSLCQ